MVSEVKPVRSAISAGFSPNTWRTAFEIFSSETVPVPKVSMCTETGSG